MASTRADPPHPPLAPHSTAPPPQAMALLLEAYDSAQELGAEVWQFAVEIQTLRPAGLRDTQLRWLLWKGYVEQALERSRPTSPRRVFRPVANLSLSDRACFVLTEAGAAYARGREGHGAEAREAEGRPFWDEARRELRLGPVVVKRFKQPAANQERILAAFEEEGWPPRIDDPLPPRADQDRQRRLHSTISNLNRSQEHRRIRFLGGGDGQSVRWQLLPPGGGTEDRASTGRK